VLDNVIHCRKAVDSTDPILCAFQAKQITDKGVGLDETQIDLALAKFRVEIQEHPRAREIDGR
jgi:hypothetical protein